MDTATSFAFLALTSANWAICFVGTMANSLIVYVSRKDSSLHQTCNVLIAVNSLADAISQGLWTLVYTAIQFAQPKWTLLFCSALAIPSLIVFILSYFCIFLTSIDRLIAILWPIHYRNVSGHVYYAILLAISSLYCILMMQFPLRNILSDPNRLVTCQPPVALFGPLGDIFHICCLILNISTACFYAFLWFLLNAKKNKMKHEETRRIFKSLLAITLVVLSGWTINAISKLVGPQFTPNTFGQIVFAKSSQILNNISVASNLFVLYFCSSKYRNAIRKLYGTIVHPTTNNNSISINVRAGCVQFNKCSIQVWPSNMVPISTPR